MSRTPIVSLIGRPNVGKSTLFNRLMGQNTRSITYDTPGVTRDRNYAITSLDELDGQEAKEYILVDTGGFYTEKIKQEEISSPEQVFFNLMAGHAEQAILESDRVLMIVDIREGPLPLDQEIAAFIRERKREFWLIVNKHDSQNLDGLEAQFYSLGVDRIFSVSAEHGRGTHELKRELQKSLLTPGLEKLKLQKGLTPKEEVVSRLAIIGAPNSGKSTLLNALLGSDRALVSPIAGTTVDPIDGFFDLYFGKRVKYLGKTEGLSSQEDVRREYQLFRESNPEFYREMEENFGARPLQLQETPSEEKEQEQDNLDNHWRSVHVVDTAGIRKKSRIESYIESQSVYRSLRSITEADIVLFIVDAVKGLSHQDQRLMGIAFEKGKSVIICLNKMDLMKDQFTTEKERETWLKELRWEIPWMDFVDVVPISAKFTKNLKQLKESIKETIFRRHQKISTGELNRTLYELLEANPLFPKNSRGKKLKLRYASKVKSSPPTFLLFTNKVKGIPDNYRRYLQKGLRKKFHFKNTPVHLVFRKGSDLKEKSPRLIQR